MKLRREEQIHAWTIAQVQWNPPDHRRVEPLVRVGIRDVPARGFSSWSVDWSTP